MTNRRRLLQAAGATVGVAALSGAPLSATGDKRRKPDFLFLSAHVRDALRQGEGARQAADAAVALSRVRRHAAPQYNAADVRWDVEGTDKSGPRLRGTSRHVEGPFRMNNPAGQYPDVVKRLSVMVLV